MNVLRVAGLSIAISVASCICVWASLGTKGPRFAIMTYEGNCTLCEGSQGGPIRPTTGGDKADVGESFPSRDIGFRCRYQLVADVQDNVIWLVLVRPLWRVDTAEMDETKTLVWRLTDEAAFFSDDGRVTRLSNKNQAYSIWTASTFLIPSGFDSQGEVISNLVANVQTACTTGSLDPEFKTIQNGRVFTSVGKYKEGSKSGFHVAYHSEGKAFHSSIFTQSELGSYRVRACLFEDDRLAEAREGVLRLERTSDTPPEVLSFEYSDAAPVVVVEPNRGAINFNVIRLPIFFLLALTFLGLCFFRGRTGRSLDD